MFKIYVKFMILTPNYTGFRSSSNGIQWSQSSLVLYTYISTMSDFGVILRKILKLN